MKKLIIFLSLLSGCGVAMGQVIKHNGYVIYYDAKIKAADSTSFTLTPTNVDCPVVTRVDMFHSDPLLPNGPQVKDFLNPPKQPDSLQIDKGHTFSFKSASCNPINRKECFYVSGMYAQFHGFNNGDWKEFEEYEQGLAAKQTIHVINGYVGIQGHLTAGEIIPAYMYKAIYHDGAYEVFIAPNRPWVHGHKIAMWHKSVSFLNALTGLKL